MEIGKHWESACPRVIARISWIMENKNIKNMNRYIYKGVVYAFEKIVSRRWEAETRAVSPEKARSNLKYRFRNQHGYSKTVPIDLPDSLIITM